MTALNLKGTSQDSILSNSRYCYTWQAAQTAQVHFASQWKHKYPYAIQSWEDNCEKGVKIKGSDMRLSLQTIKKQIQFAQTKRKYFGTIKFKPNI